jgi:23S rRNA (cytosine1962-C5)-methyltransferase
MTTPPYASAPTDPKNLPVVRLLPKANARAIRQGFPWVYANEMVVDRRTKGLAPGSLAILEDAERQVMGIVAVNPLSKIFCRMLDQNAEAHVTENWFAFHIARALKLREQLYDAPFYRLIHAEADGLPGVVIDRFGDTAVIQPNAAWADVHLDALTEALVEQTGIRHVLKNAAGRTRTLEGLDDASTVLRGDTPAGPIQVPMNRAIYMADLTGGQKTGIFYDQRPNHAFAANLSKGKRVLDVFAHVGGFGLAALANGAASVLAVDGSAPALALAEEGAAAMGVSDTFATRQGDAFDVLTALRAEGEEFDVVICDPPAFAPGKPALEAGLRAYERLARLAAPLVAEDGILGLCSCSHAADLTQFRTASIRGIGRAGRRAAMLHTGFAGPDHPQLPQLAETGYLKSLFFRL